MTREEINRAWFALAAFAASIIILLAIPAPKPPTYITQPLPPACKVCHCGKTSCHRDCGEEAMCNAKCEGLCQTKK